MKEKPKKRPVKGAAKAKIREKKLVTGQTEVMDFDIEEEIRLREEKKAARKAARKAACETGEKAPEESKTAAASEEKAEEIVEEKELNQTWDTMPEKEVSLGNETMELLGLDELLDEVYPETEDEIYDNAAVKSSGTADYMDFVPKKMTGKSDSAATAKKAGAAVAVSGKKKQAAAKKYTESYESVPVKKTAKTASGKKRKKAGFLAGMDMMDRIIAATGVLVVLAAVLTAGIYTTAQSAKKQVAAMAEVGMKMETIGIAGEGIFTAVADARIAALEAAEYAEEVEAGVEEYEEKELTTEVKVGLKLTSVQRDLKIKFTNKSSGKLIGNQPFEVAIDGPEDMTKVDDDEDGIIYISSIKPGEYTVTITAPEEIDGNKVKGVSSIVTVKDQIEYKKIDVVDEVKTEAEVNAAQEDTAVKVETESVSTDTVEWVESTKTAIGGSVSYVEVSRSDIPDPAATASAGFVKIAAAKQVNDIADSSMFLMKGESDSISFWSLPKKMTHARAMENMQALHKAGSSAGLVLVDQTTSGGSVSGGEIPAPVKAVVASVKINGQTEAEVNSTVTLTAELAMESGSADNVEITWTGASGSGTTATVTSSEEKTVEVTVSAGGKTATHSVSFKKSEQAPVTPPATDPVPTGVEISASKTTANVGETIQLSAVVTMSDGSTNGDVTWSANGGTLDTSVNPVTLKCDEAKTVTVKAVAGEAKDSVDIGFARASVSVTGVTLNQTALTLTAGKSQQLTATVAPENATEKGVEWTSSDTAVATVDGSGNVKAVAAGSADITVKTKDGGFTAACKVTVNAAAVLGVTLDSPGSLNIGEEKTLKWTTTGDVDTSKTTFTSSNTSLATVDNSGKVKALAKGSVTITVTVTDKNDSSKTASATGTLTINPAGSVTIKLNPTSMSIKVGEKVTISAEVNTVGDKGLTWKSGDESYVKIISSNDTICTLEGIKPGTIAITATSKEKTDVKAVCEVKVTAAADLTALLRDKSGNQLYVKSGDTYREATVADYYNFDKFYRKQDSSQYLYTGWQNLDGKRYYFDKNGVPVTGDHIIQGMQYSFNSDGSLKVTGAFGIDVSKHNGNIDWNAVKNAGVDFVIIRCGYRGSATGVLVEDPKFKTNIQGAAAAGLKVGIYFFSQAVNEVEAVEEASMTLSLINKYKITYPVYMDVEAANGRADGMNAATRTKVIKAYCQTIKNSGYTAGIYANKSWLNGMFNVGELGSYKIWLAQYAAVPTYNGRYEMWQYSSTGRISGISGNVDLNTSYMTY